MTKTEEAGHEECNHFYGLAIMDDNTSIPLMKNVPIEKEKIVAIFGFIFCPWCGGQFDIGEVETQVH